jgi:serine protease Do
MSSGVVSGLGRYVGLIRDDNGRPHGYENFIQVDAAINPGNSGGPLTDVRGRVVGMNTAIATRRRDSFEQSYFEGQFAGIGLAIPLEMIEPVVRQLIETGTVAKGYLGVELMEDLDALAAANLRRLGFVGQGVMIRTTRPDGPARDAGLRPGDLVTAINDRAISSVAQLRSMISSMLPGDQVRIGVWRYDEEEAEGEEKIFEVQLARLGPLVNADVLVPGQRDGSILPLGILKMSTNAPDLAREFSTAFTPGVLVQRLAQDSPIAETIPEGSTIIAVDNQPVTTLEQLHAALEQYDLRNGVFVTVVRPTGEKSREVLRVNLW